MILEELVSLYTVALCRFLSLIENGARILPVSTGRGIAPSAFLFLTDVCKHIIMIAMKLIAQVKLQPTEEQAAALAETIRQANAACNYLSDQAWKSQCFRQYALHGLAYHETRKQFPDLSSQVIVRCIARVADAYKLDRTTKHEFRSLSAIAYDERILRWYTDERSLVSIWTVSGRQKIPYVCGDRQRELLKSQQGQSDLVLRDGEFYLYATCNVEEPPKNDPDGFLGIDLGVVNIAVDSDGDVYSGSHVNNAHHRHRRLRKKLQKKGTKSARRLLQKRRRRESRFAKDVNHCISKQVVAKAERTGRGIALEDLAGIRGRIRARRSQRATLHSWSFHDLRFKIDYKARRAGVPVVFVDPRNTSRLCPICGYCDKRNRPDQSTFSCKACGYAGFADYIAATNISRRAVVSLPNVSSLAA